ncbi:MAG TPA: 16S rRNA (guanine(527)-N(7))-methyltransferase RsmG [Candidatus Aquicultor sp.]|jgi:16S rRNA (guanine527-N7)-methyltransferase
MNPTPAELLAKGASELNIKLTDAQVTDFMRYLVELQEWNDRFNLTTITDPHDIVTKHFLDSISLLSVCNIPYSAAVVDIGAGAGFPGIPLKITRPDIELTLLESSIKKAGFLEHITDILELSEVTVVAQRAEDFGRIQKYREYFNMALSRAVAEVAVLAEYALPLVIIGGRFVCYKAKGVEEEVKKAEFAVHILGGCVEEIAQVMVPFLQAERYLVSIAKEKSTPPTYPRKAGIPTKRPLLK